MQTTVEKLSKEKEDLLQLAMTRDGVVQVCYGCNETKYIWIQFAINIWLTYFLSINNNHKDVMCTLCSAYLTL